MITTTEGIGSTREKLDPVQFRIAEIPVRGCAHQMQRQRRLLIEFEAAIDAKKLIVLLDKVITGGNQANAALLANVALQSQNADVSFLINQREVE